VSGESRLLIVLSTLAALALIVLGVFPPVQVARVYLLALIALAAAVVAGRTLSRFGPLERSRRKEAAEEPEAPPFFERAKRRVELANASGVYFEQLRPRLREIADQRLGARGLRLTSEEARQLLGDEAWRALDRPPEGDKFAPPPEGQLAGVIGALERI
jgi:hypothetical protein